MVRPEDITVTTSALFPNLDPIWMLAHTCERFGIPLKPYGLGETYGGWVQIKITMLKKVAEECPTSHLLYTDGRDAWFLAGLDEIAAKYNTMGAPPLLLSAQSDIFGSYGQWYTGIPFNETKRFRYVGTPGQLCEAKALAEALGWMQQRTASGEWGQMPDDDPAWWLNFMRERPGKLKFDHDCQIFMNAGSYIQEGMWENVLRISKPVSLSGIDIGRVYNTLTDSWPCILHFNGGSSDALKGKWDDLKHYWMALGYTKRPPWEQQ